MQILYFLSERIFRFRYRDPNTGPATWDIGIYEQDQEKMLRDFFIMGCVTAAIAIIILAVTGASAWLIINH